MSENLVQFGEIRAKFIIAGDIIERGSMIYVALDTPPIASTVRLGHIVRCFRNETGGIEALSMHADLFVPKYDTVTDEEWAAVVEK